MAENNQTANNPAQNKKVQTLQPTLFIGVGGSGLKVISGIRRRILHETWGTRDSPVRVPSLEQFPVAAFIHFDLDQNAEAQGGRPPMADPLSELVRLTDQDKVVSALDLSKYIRNDDDIDKYPHIKSWFPMTAVKVRSLGIDPTKGAGQIRSISRLYFFDHYRQIQTAIRGKLEHLRASRSSRHQLKRLNLDVESDGGLRIVVVASIAGGTGSGSFLDMGWLTRLLAGVGGAKYDVQSVLFTPRGYVKYNKERVEGNGYAAFMELESCMLDSPVDYLPTWSPDDGKPELDRKPYTDVYLLETVNMGGHALEEMDDVYEMVADSLFEDFANAEFARNKRSTAVNQQQHKALPYSPPVIDDYGSLKLKYSMGYSSFGQSILDTQHQLRLDEQEYAWCAAMLEAFFCVSGRDIHALHADDKQRDGFLKDHLQLFPQLFDRLPDFGDNKECRDLGQTFTDNSLTDDLLIGMEEAIQQKVNAVVDAIIQDENNITQWPQLLRERIPQLEIDVMSTVDKTAETAEDRIARKRKQIFEGKKTIIREKFYQYLDNQELGGLEYVLSLIDLIKTHFDNPDTGLVKVLTENQERYHRVKDAVRTYQIERSLQNIAGAVKKGFFTKPDVAKAKGAYAEHLKKDIGDYLRFHVRGIAAMNAASLLRDLSEFLGKARGAEEGRAVYTGLMKEFQDGRRDVLALAEEIRGTTARIQDSAKKSHANYIVLPTEAKTIILPDEAQLRAWANDAFKDFQGSKQIFPMLKNPQERKDLLALLRNKALAERAKTLADIPDDGDPLVRKLNGMTPEQRMEKFSELLRAAMPWIGANFADVPQNPAKFTCFLGVGDKEECRPFKDELESCTPTSAGITAAQIHLCATGIPGRAVCYCELSGFPLRVLSGLGDWRTSYRRVIKDWPLHTHIDPTLFVQPMVPTTPELKASAADFRLFLLAVILRILTRSPEKTMPPGQYRYDFGRGERMNLSSEKAFRVHGFPAMYRETIDQAVQDKLGNCDKFQLQALATLANFTGRETYKPPIARDDNTGQEFRVPGFSHAIALSLAKELSALAKRHGLEDDEATRIENQLIDWDKPAGSLGRWTEIIEGSASDAYNWEVAAPENAKMPDKDRGKRRVKKEFFETGLLTGIISASPDPPQPIIQTAVPTPGVTPPPPPVTTTYWLSISGQQHGPFAVPLLQEWIKSGQVAPTTLAWREGIAQWQALNTLPEFAPPPPPSPSMTPPPPPGAPPPQTPPPPSNV
jgi:hypothetical protein